MQSPPRNHLALQQIPGIHSAFTLLHFHPLNMHTTSMQHSLLSRKQTDA